MIKKGVVGVDRVASKKAPILDERLSERGIGTLSSGDQALPPRAPRLCRGSRAPNREDLEEGQRSPLWFKSAKGSLFSSKVQWVPLIQKCKSFRFGSKVHKVHLVQQGNLPLVRKSIILLCTTNDSADLHSERA